MDALKFKLKVIEGDINKLVDLKALNVIQATEERDALIKLHIDRLPGLSAKLDEIADEFAIKLKNDEMCEAIDAISKLKDLCDLQIVSARTETDLKPDIKAESNTLACVNLPKLNIPVFKGDILAYESFRKLFDVMILNNHQLEDPQKVAYLVSLLSGEPRELIRHAALDSEGLRFATKILDERYSSSRHVTQTLIDKLFEIKPITTRSLTTVQSLHDAVSEILEALQVKSINIDSLFLARYLLRLLDKRSRELFEAQYMANSVPDTKSILNFLKNQIKFLQNVELDKSNPVYSNFKIQIKKVADSPITQKTRALSISTSTGISCLYCHDKHKIYSCHKYLQLEIPERKSFVINHKLCLSCLNPKHSVKDCSSKILCRICNLKHHSTICNLSDRASSFNRHSISSTQPINHNNSNPVPPSPVHITHVNPNPNQASPISQSTSVPLSPSTSNSNVTLTVSVPDPERITSSSQILLSTVQLNVFDSLGYPHKVRGLLDSAAEHSFITTSLAQKLNLNIHGTELSVSGLSNNRVKLRGTTRARVSSQHQDFDSFLTVGVVDTITSHLPSMPVSKSFLTQFTGLTLADNNFDKPGCIDVLLDASIFSLTLLKGRLTPGPNLPLLFETKFGWVLTGRAPIACLTSVVPPTLSVFITTCCDINLSIKKFWEWESPPETSKSIDPTEKLFLQTVYKLPSGRFGVRLPFCQSPSKLGQSFSNAKRFLFSLEKKFSDQPKLKNAYLETMRSLIKSKVLTPMSQGFIPPSGHYFIPHFPILRNNSDSSKMRIVYHASMKTSNGMSLNQILSAGPPLQSDNLTVLTQFRLFAVAFSCDIKAMFTQIEIHPDDRHFQLVLWREDSDQLIQIYTYNRVIFGETSSPFLAIRTLKYAALEGKEQYPLASETISNNSFVDDVLCSFPNLKKALECKQQLIELLASSGFELGKWISNREELLADLNSESCLRSKNIHDPTVSAVSVLGLRWNPESDTFYFYLANYNHNQSPTKRNILSLVAKIYDPLGFLSPITSWIKIFLQSLWLKGIDWDEDLPSELQTKWFTFINDLEHISIINIPRVILSSDFTNFQIHGFADASQKSYAAVVYSRLELSSGEIVTNLIISKSKVCPLKAVTIPRLELNAALLLAKLINHIVSILSPKISIDSVHSWSDSSIVLAWIKTPPHSLKTYVANRVQQILDLTSPNNWHHVSTKCNPADLPSRGVLPSALPSLDLWWKGPKFLHHSPESWPKLSSQPRDLELPDLKSSSTVLVSTQSPFYINFSSWSKVIRFSAYYLRYFKFLKGKFLSGPLRVEELKDVETRLIRSIQMETFSEVLKNITNNQPLPPKFRKLSAFIDKQGILRAGGRLDLSNQPYSVKHPIILPKCHHLVNLLVRKSHVDLLHAGPQAVFHDLLRTYWILSGRSVVRKIIHSCVTCFRAKPSRTPPLMGSLPTVRLTPSRPFSRIGLDYSGFFTLKLNRTRKALTTDKAYVCLFICLCTRAVHLEVVTDMSTPAFIAALTRFTSRRGLCSDIYCDRGTNFIGGSTQLHKMLVSFLQSHQSEISNYASGKGIQFHFLPPAAPFQGGIWESAIKMAKYHLRRVMKNQLLTLEEFNTLVIQVESVLNSRPISHPSSDPSDLSPLTPGHFLIGTSLQSLPEPNYSESKISPHYRWRYVQQMYQHFWHRWLKEYLPSLLPRNKWNKPTVNLKPNDMVIVHEDNIAPLYWPLARVLQVEPGHDDVVRVAKVRTPKGEITRPALKLYPLPIH